MNKNLTANANSLYGGILMQEIVSLTAKRPEVRMSKLEYGMSKLDGRGATTVTRRNCNAQRSWRCQ